MDLAWGKEGKREEEWGSEESAVVEWDGEGSGMGERYSSGRQIDREL